MADTFPYPRSRSATRPPLEPRAPGGRVGYWSFDTTSPITAGTWIAARAALDVALSAADAVLAGEAVAYGLCRPPGHHAGRVDLRRLLLPQQRRDRRRAPGAAREPAGSASSTSTSTTATGPRRSSGSAATCRTPRSTVTRTASTRTSRATPTRRGEGAGAGATFNQPLPAGTDDTAYLAALDRALDWLAGRHDGIVVVSLGIDTYGLDPICDFALTTPAYHEVGRRVAATGARLVVLQEGGYHVAHLGENVRRWLRGAAGLTPDPAARPGDGG